MQIEHVVMKTRMLLSIIQEQLLENPILISTDIGLSKREDTGNPIKQPFQENKYEINS